MHRGGVAGYVVGQCDGRVVNIFQAVFYFVSSSSILLLNLIKDLVQASESIYISVFSQ